MKKYNRNFVIYSDELGDILAIVLCNNSDYEKIQAWIEQFYKEYEDMFEEYLENIVEILKNKMSGGNSTHSLILT